MKPRKHQQDALNKIIPALTGTGTRATVAMACGSGKTLVGIRAVEDVVVDNADAKIIVFVPNLPLLDQVMTDWVKADAFGGDFMARPVASVGSSLYGEDTAGELKGVEPQILAKTKVKPVILENTTSDLDVAEDLRRPGRVVFFCTYQSSAVIQLALMNVPGFSFDFAVMDEAHRTAGAGRVKDSPYQLCLSDDHIRIKRRLFMTATPRVHKARKTSKTVKGFDSASADALLDEYIDHGVSMNDESVYGPICFEFSFAEAIGAGILSDYRVYAVAISDDDIRAAAAGNKAVSLEGVNLSNPDADQVEFVASARNLALIAAVGRMVEQGTVSGALAFHRDTKRSRRFTKDSKGYLSTHPNPTLSKAFADHVEGVTPPLDRQKTLDDFDTSLKLGQFAIVSNCAVLTEGYDLPELDTTIFADAKYSKISIVQAAGRALRKDPANPGKVASIVVPVFIGQAEDPEEMVELSAFNRMYEIITALRENDNMSAYFTDAILNDATDREEETQSDATMIGVQDSEGNSVTGEDGVAPISLILPLSLGVANTMSLELKKSYSKFAKACQSKIVGSNASVFERNLAKLKLYKAHHGHCSMGPTATIDKFPIGKVMSHVRDQFDLGNLPEYQREAYVAEGYPLKSIDELSALIHETISAQAK